MPSAISTPTAQQLAANIKCATTATAPTTGYLQEYREAIGSTTAITTAQYSDGGSAGLLLPAGVWDLQATAYIVPAATTKVSVAYVGIATSSGNAATGEDYNRNVTQISNVLGDPVATIMLATPMFRVIANGSTTYYPKSYVTFDTSTCTALNLITARRVA